MVPLVLLGISAFLLKGLGPFKNKGQVASRYSNEAFLIKNKLESHELKFLTFFARSIDMFWQPEKPKTNQHKKKEQAAGRIGHFHEHTPYLKLQKSLLRQLKKLFFQWTPRWWVRSFDKGKTACELFFLVGFGWIAFFFWMESCLQSSKSHCDLFSPWDSG